MPALESYAHSPVDKRDPFTTIHQQVPDVKVGLQQWPLEQLNLKGTVTGIASPSAVILDPESHAWLVRIGDKVGNKDGKVTAIERDQIVVTEIIGGAEGRLFRQPIKLGLASPGALENQGHVIDLPAVR